MSFKKLLHSYLATPRPGRHATTIHASDLLNEKREWCEREVALCHELDRERPPERLIPAQRAVFEASTMGQTLITQWAVNLGIARGRWQCQGCDALTKFGPRPHMCDVCGSQNLAYVESRFVSKFSRVSSGIDLLLDLGEPKLRVYEIKNVQKQDFMALAGPLAEHRWRTNLYLRVIAESDDPVRETINTERAWVLYFVKGGYGYKDPDLGGGFSPFKEYEVVRDDADTQKYSERAHNLARYMLGTGGRPHGICASIFQPRAKQCAVVDECFSGKFPPGGVAGG